MANSRFTAIIAARDAASPALGAIARRVRALTGDLSGLRRAAEAVRGRAGVAGGFAAGFLAPFAAVGVGGATKGLTDLAARTAEGARGLSDLAERSGVTVERLQGLAAVARASGIEAEALVEATERLNRGLGDAARGKAPELAAALRRLGIATRDNGGLRSAVDLLPQLAEAVSRTRDPVQRLRLVTTFFGEEGAKLIPMLAGGSRALRETTQDWYAFGHVLDRNAVAALGRANRSFRQLSMSADGTREAVGGVLARVFAPYAETLAKVLRANRGVIATRVDDWAKGIASVLPSTREEWEKLGKSLGDAMDAFKREAGDVRAQLRGIADRYREMRDALAPVWEAWTEVHRRVEGFEAFLGGRVRAAIQQTSLDSQGLGRAWDGIRAAAEGWRDALRSGAGMGVPKPAPGGPAMHDPEAWRRSYDPPARSPGGVPSYLDPDAWRRSFRPGSFGGGGGGPGSAEPGAGGRGAVDVVEVRFANAPPGTRVDHTPAIAPARRRQLVLNVGYAFGPPPSYRTT